MYVSAPLLARSECRRARVRGRARGQFTPPEIVDCSLVSSCVAGSRGTEGGGAWVVRVDIGASVAPGIWTGGRPWVELWLAKESNGFGGAHPLEG